MFDAGYISIRAMEWKGDISLCFRWLRKEVISYEEIFFRTAVKNKETVWQFLQNPVEEWNDRLWERNYRLKYEISFSELTQKELRQLEIMDDYIVESEMFHVFDYDIEVKDELIGEALKSLPEKKRNVILLSFFLDMTDTEIAKYMNLVRSTIHHHRTSSLIALKKIMEEIRTGKKK